MRSFSAFILIFDLGQNFCVKLFCFYMALIETLWTQVGTVMSHCDFDKKQSGVCKQDSAVFLISLTAIVHIIGDPITKFVFEIVQYV